MELFFGYFTFIVFHLSSFTTLQGKILSAVYCILIFEVGSLQPLLDERATMIIGDKEVDKNDHKHVMYVVLELLKVTGLITFVVLHLIK